MLLDCLVHRIGSKVKIAWPRNSPEFDANLCELAGIGEPCEYTCSRRI